MLAICARIKFQYICILIQIHMKLVFHTSEVGYEILPFCGSAHLQVKYSSTCTNANKAYYFGIEVNYKYDILERDNFVSMLTKVTEWYHVTCVLLVYINCLFRAQRKIFSANISFCTHIQAHYVYYEIMRGQKLGISHHFTADMCLNAF